MDIRQHDICRALRSSTQETLAVASRELRFRKGDLIYPPGGDFGRVYLLGEGAALIGTYSPFGTRRVISTIVRANGIFGDLTAALGSADVESDTFAESLTDAQAFCCPSQIFAECVSGEKEALVLILAYVLRRLREGEAKLRERAFCSVSERVVRELVRLGRQVGHAQKDELVGNRRITHEQLAAMVGASRETVTEALHDLAKRGLVTTSGKGLMVSESLVLLGDD